MKQLENGRDRAAWAETKRKETISKGVDTHRRSPKKALTDCEDEGQPARLPSEKSTGTSFAGILNGFPKRVEQFSGLHPTRRKAEPAPKNRRRPDDFPEDRTQIEICARGAPFFSGRASSPPGIRGPRRRFCSDFRPFGSSKAFESSPPS